LASSKSAALSTIDAEKGKKDERQKKGKRRGVPRRWAIEGSQRKERKEKGRLPRRRKGTSEKEKTLLSPLAKMQSAEEGFTTWWYHPEKTQWNRTETLAGETWKRVEKPILGRLTGNQSPPGKVSTLGEGGRGWKIPANCVGKKR